MNSILFLFTSIFALAAKGAPEPPKVYVDKGACPFECCTYREWTVNKDTPLYSAVNGKKIVGTAKANRNVTAVTGEVHVVPAKIVVKEAHGSYKPGDVFYVLTYEGEGSYKVWKNGDISSDGEVYELFDNSSPKLRKIWGEWKSKPESTWWVKIKLPDGVEGWTKQTKNFGNMDACGG
jgi:hypothetical protein